MGAAITLLVILTFSVVVVRTAAVALRLTGMPADVARFQARSAFTGAGFTTSESEAVRERRFRLSPNVCFRPKAVIHRIAPTARHRRIL